VAGYGYCNVILVYVVCTASYKQMAMSHEFDVFENCFITFPSLFAGEDQDVSTELKYKNDVPVVILLGWGGCQQRHLRKYCAIYEKR